MCLFRSDNQLNHGQKTKSESVQGEFIWVSDIGFSSQILLGQLKKRHMVVLLNFEFVLFLCVYIILIYCQTPNAVCMTTNPSKQPGLLFWAWKMTPLINVELQSKQNAQKFTSQHEFFFADWTISWFECTLPEQILAESSNKIFVTLEANSPRKGCNFSLHTVFRWYETTQSILK